MSHDIFIMYLPITLLKLTTVDSAMFKHRDTVDLDRKIYCSVYTLLLETLNFELLYSSTHEIIPFLLFVFYEIKLPIVKNDFNS